MRQAALCTLVALVCLFGVSRALSCMKCEQQICPSVQCAGKVVKDVCGCCDKCAGQPGDRCGGPWNALGVCDDGLECMRHGEAMPHFEQRPGKCQPAGMTIPPPFNFEVGGPNPPVAPPAPVNNTRLRQPVTEAPDLCPPGTPAVQCFADPCSVDKCEAFPKAECRASFCGGCFSKFFVDGQEVTARCKPEEKGLKPQTSDPVCPPGVTAVQCFADPCSMDKCDAFPNAECRASYCGGCFTKYFVDGTEVTDQCSRTQPEAARECKFNGQTFKDGESFKDDCNTCTCTSGMTVCTEKACEVPPPPPTTTEPPKPMVCVHEGKEYKEGQSFKIECNRCRCLKGKAACTKMACFKEPVVCKHKGVAYKPGASFMDDCNRCICGSRGLAACTMKMCFRPPPSKRTTTTSATPTTPRPAGPNAPYLNPTLLNVLSTFRGRRCRHQGREYRPLETYNKGCASCVCLPGGFPACSMRDCVAADQEAAGEGVEAGQVKVKGRCVYKGKTYRRGQSFRDNCNRCFCGGSGNVGCTFKACPRNGSRQN